MNKEPMHPSGLTMRAWNWPFKSAKELKQAADWFKKQEREKRLQQPEALV